MDFDILYAIQGIRTEWLDSFMLWLTNFVGSYGQLWLVVGIVMFTF